MSGRRGPGAVRPVTSAGRWPLFVAALALAAASCGKASDTKAPEEAAFQVKAPVKAQEELAGAAAPGPPTAKPLSANAPMEQARAQRDSGGGLGGGGDGQRFRGRRSKPAVRADKKAKPKKKPRAKRPRPDYNAIVKEEMKSKEDKPARMRIVAGDAGEEVKEEEANEQSDKWAGALDSGRGKDRGLRGEADRRRAQGLRDLKKGLVDSEDDEDATGEAFDFAQGGDGVGVAPSARRGLGPTSGKKAKNKGRGEAPSSRTRSHHRASVRNGLDAAPEKTTLNQRGASLGALANLLADGRPGAPTGGADDGWGARDDPSGDLFWSALPDLERAAHLPPTRFLPRMFYFENTYLGGSAAASEHLRRLQRALGARADVLARASAYEQAFDPPQHAGVAVTAELDRSWVDRPTRVYLQVGLRGSERFGWRRPPLDVVAVVDGDVPAHAREELVIGLLRRLGPRDRLGVVVAGVGPGASPDVLAAPRRLRDVRAELTRGLERLGTDRRVAGPASLAAAMRRAGVLLRDAAMAQATVPGTQTLLLLTDATDGARVEAAARAASELTVQGVVTSVLQLGDGATRAWWPVANQGYGNYHLVARAGGAEATSGVAAALDAELASLSKVVARLLRLNVRLAPGVKAVRVVGSRKLADEEVRAVKAREVATDRALSKTLGVAADRGEDDDGIQTVIPYFYGGDAHVVLVELWVTRPGPVAEVTLKYKDMVNLGNATARASARLQAAPRRETPGQRSVARNLVGARLAERLAQAARGARRARAGQVRAALADARRLAAVGEPADRALVAGLWTLADAVERAQDLGDGRSWALLADALDLAHDRKLGQPPVAVARADDR